MLLGIAQTWVIIKMDSCLVLCDIAPSLQWMFILSLVRIVWRSVSISETDKKIVSELYPTVSDRNQNGEQHNPDQ